MSRITQGSFALIPQGKCLLLTRRPDEQWNLPGGGIEIGEGPREAVLREAYEEVNLTITIIGQLGGPLLFTQSGYADIAWAWRCVSMSQSLPQPSEEVVEYRYIRVEELYLRNDDVCLIDSPYPLPCGTSTNILGRTCRMIYDWFSLQAPPLLSFGTTHNVGDVAVSSDGRYLVHSHASGQQWWKRLDPFSTTGYR